MRSQSHAFSKLKESREVAPGSIAGLIDHTLLSPVATYGEIKTLCEEALRYGFFSVCVNPFFIKAAKDILKDSSVKVTTVIGFPLGMTLTEVKVYEAMTALLLGADELDIVINLGALKSGDWSVVRKDISDVISATGGHIHKAIIETCYLTDEEKRIAVDVALNAGSEFIKTSSGFGPKGATVKDIRLIREIIGEKAGIKAAGGIRTLKRLLTMIKAGAARIGTSSGARIMKELECKD